MIDHFGTTIAGDAVHAITLGGHGLRARLLTRGAIVQDLRLDGIAHRLTLGSDRLADYEGEMRYSGALVGPVANRIGQASLPLGGRTLKLTPDRGSPHLLHSGAHGLHQAIWTVGNRSRTAVTLTCTRRPDDDGFPGTRQIEAQFSLHPPATLRLSLRATTDTASPINIANHSYWNLDGTETWAGHRLRIAADAYLPVTDDILPTGEIRPVTGTAMDLRPASQRSDPTPGAPALDHNFCLSTGPTALRDVLWLTGQSGVSMTMATTEPGLQVFDGRPGYAGLALEAQGWPDAPNQRQFPAITTTAQNSYRQVTEWRLTARQPTPAHHLLAKNIPGEAQRAGGGAPKRTNIS